MIVVGAGFPVTLIRRTMSSSVTLQYLLLATIPQHQNHRALAGVEKVQTPKQWADYCL
jgi:hypothetical protein